MYGIPEANILGRIPGREKKFRAAGEKAIMDGETIMEGDGAKAIMEGNGNEAFMEDDGANVVMEEDGDKTVMEGNGDKTAMKGNEGDTYEIVTYLTRNEYPEGATKAEKGSIRKRAKKFRMVDGLLHYTGGKDGMLRQVSL